MAKEAFCCRSCARASLPAILGGSGFLWSLLPVTSSDEVHILIHAHHAVFVVIHPVNLE